MKKLIYRPLILSFALILTLIFVLQVSYGYFDNLQGSKSSTILIGDWLSNIPGPNDVEDYVNEVFPDPDDGTDKDFVLDVIGDYVNGEYVLSDVIDNYTMGELIETIELIKEFRETYLDESLRLPSNAANKPPLTKLKEINSFLPGDVQYKKQTFLLAQYADDTKNTPVTFQVAIDLDGVDLSDFSIEVLIDRTPFSTTVAPFRYSFNVYDEATNNYNIIGNNNNNNNLDYIDNLIPMGTNTLTYNIVNNYSNTTYRHTYHKPETIGEWSRFKYGPNLNIQTSQDYLVGASNTGMKIIGKPSGSQAVLSFDIRFRQPRLSTSLPIIPVTLVISRGRMVDSAGNDIDARTNPVTPNISIRVVDDVIDKNPT